MRKSNKTLPGSAARAQVSLAQLDAQLVEFSLEMCKPRAQVGRNRGRASQTQLAEVERARLVQFASVRLALEVLCAAQARYVDVLDSPTTQPKIMEARREVEFALDRLAQAQTKTEKAKGVDDPF